MYVTQFDFLEILYEQYAYRKRILFLGKFSQKVVHNMRMILHSGSSHFVIKDPLIYKLIS
jgi:hypothetical protein